MAYRVVVNGEAEVVKVRAANVEVITDEHDSPTYYKFMDEDEDVVAVFPFGSVKYVAPDN